MTLLKFDLDIDAEIQKLGLPVANPANPANREENRAKISNFSKISNPYNDLSHSPIRRGCYMSQGGGVTCHRGVW